MVELKMSTTEQATTQEMSNNTNIPPPEQGSHVSMESVNRVAKLPVVEATINAASNLYGMAKDSHSMINYALTTAESTVKSGMEKITPLAQPVTTRLEGPMKKVDGMLCTGLDYVESKVPCVKLPPGEMLENTKNYINDTVQPAVQSARNVVEPAVQTARNVVEPAVQTAKHVVEPAMQTATAVKDYGMQKVDEMMHGKRSETTSDGRPRRVRPALLPSSFVSLVYMSVSLEQLMQHQDQHHEHEHEHEHELEHEHEHEHPNVRNSITDGVEQPHTCERHAKKDK